MCLQKADTSESPYIFQKKLWKPKEHKMIYYKALKQMQAKQDYHSQQTYFFLIDGEIKTFQDKHESLQKMLRGILHTEVKINTKHSTEKSTRRVDKQNETLEELNCYKISKRQELAPAFQL